MVSVGSGCAPEADAEAVEDALEDVSGCPLPHTSGPEPELLATGVPAPAAIALDEEFVWFTASAGSSVGRVARDGSAPPEVFADELAFPIAIAVDETRVYVSTGAGVIWAIERDSRTRTEFVTGQARPQDLLRVGTGLYWANEGTAGGTIHDPVFNHDAGFAALELDHLDRDGDTPRMLLVGEDWARGLSIAEGVAYGVVSSAGDTRIMAMPLAGGAPWVVAHVAGAVRDVAVHDGYVYWTRPLACAVRRVAAQGGPVETVALDQNVPQMIWADEQGLVWTNGGRFGADYQGSSVMAADADGHGQRVIAAGHNAFALVVSGDEVFFSNNELDGQIARAARW